MHITFNRNHQMKLQNTLINTNRHLRPSAEYSIVVPLYQINLFLEIILIREVLLIINSLLMHTYNHNHNHMISIQMVSKLISWKLQWQGASFDLNRPQNMDHSELSQLNILAKFISQGSVCIQIPSKFGKEVYIIWWQTWTEPSSTSWKAILVIQAYTCQKLQG